MTWSRWERWPRWEWMAWPTVVQLIEKNRFFFQVREIQPSLVYTTVNNIMIPLEIHVGDLGFRIWNLIITFFHRFEDVLFWGRERGMGSETLCKRIMFLIIIFSHHNPFITPNPSIRSTLKPNSEYDICQDPFELPFNFFFFLSRYIYSISIFSHVNHFSNLYIQIL